MTGELENYTNLLIKYGELSTNELFEKSFTVNKNHFLKKLGEFKELGFIEPRKDGNKIFYSLSNPDIQTSVFIKDFRRRIQRYDNELKKLFIALEENLPMVNPDQPMINVKVKQRKHELDKKGVMRRTGNYEWDDSYKTWNVRKKPQRYLEEILRLLKNFKQDTTELSFETDIIPELELLRKYQTKAIKTVNIYIKKLEDMFQGTIDWAFVVWKMRVELHASIYRKTLEHAMHEAEQKAKKN